MTDSPRWCAICDRSGDHHTDRHPNPYAWLTVTLVDTVTNYSASIVGATMMEADRRLVIAQELAAGRLRLP